MEFYLIDAVKLKKYIENPDYALDWIKKIIDTAPVIEIKRKQESRRKRYETEYYCNCCSEDRGMKPVRYEAILTPFQEFLYCPECGRTIDVEDAAAVCQMMLSNAFDENGNIYQYRVDKIVNLYLENANTAEEYDSDDDNVFHTKSEQAFLTAMIYYVLENDNIPKKDKTFETILQKMRMETSSDCLTFSPLQKEIYDWFVEIGLMTYSETDEYGNQIQSEEDRYTETKTEKGCMTKCYYNTFLITPRGKDIAVNTTIAELQKFLKY